MPRALTRAINAETSFSFGPVSIPNNLEQLDLRIPRATTAQPTRWADPATKVTVSVEISLDGGAIWRPWFAFTAEGGIVKTPQNTDAEYSGWALPILSGTGRQARGSVSCTGPALTSTLTVDVN